MGKPKSKYSIFTRVEWSTASILFYVLIAFVSIFFSAILEPMHAKIFEYTGSDGAILTILSTLCVAPLFFVLFLNKWVTVIVTPFVMYIGAVSNIINSKLNEYISQFNAPIIFEARSIAQLVDATDSMSFVTLMFLFGIVIGVIRFIYAYDESTVRKGQAFAIIMILMAGSVNIIKEKYPNYTPIPYGFITSVQEHSKATLYSLLFENRRANTINASKTSDITTVVVFIDKFANIAIKNNSVPQLSKSRGLVTASYVIEAYPAARELSHIVYNDDNFLLSAFQSAGMPIEWITISNLFKKNNLATERLAKKSDNYTYIDNPLHPNPFLSIDTLNQFIDKYDNGLLVVNIEGTPQSLANRYPESYHRHEASDKENSYINYTSYIDAFLYEVIKILEDEKSMLFVIPLDGEHVEGYDSLSALFWQSRKLAQEKELHNYKRMLKAHDIFASILHCSGLSHDLADVSGSICK